MDVLPLPVLNSIIFRNAKLYKANMIPINCDGTSSLIFFSFERTRLTEWTKVALTFYLFPKSFLLMLVAAVGEGLV